MSIKLMKEIWGGVNETDLQATTLGFGGSNPEDVGANWYMEKYNLDSFDAYAAARRDLDWADGQVFLDKHPKRNRLPWSGKKGNRG